MNKEDLLSSDFLNQFKTNEFSWGIVKARYWSLIRRGIRCSLDYERYQKSKGNNYRNGHTTKQVKSSFDETEISVPRDRERSFNPMLVKKQQNTIDGIEISLSHCMPKNECVRYRRTNTWDLYFDLSISAILK